MCWAAMVRRRAVLFVAFAVVASLLVSCAMQRKAAAPGGAERAVVESAPQAAFGGAPAQALESGAKPGDAAERRVVKRAELTVDVEDAVEASDRIAARAEAMGGYVSSSVVGRNREGRSEVRITMRVPADRFTALVEEVEKLGTLVSRQISSADVTEEYVDLEARISNLKHQEKRLLEIVSQARTVEDLLKVEKEIERVRGQIESLTARLNLLRNQADYATVKVYLRSTPLAAVGVSTSGVQGLWGRSVRALYGSLTVLIGAAGRAVVALFAALPYLVLLALAGWAAWRLGRRLRASGRRLPALGRRCPLFRRASGGSGA